jgi:uncharacterized protein YjiS (DUF1127 family)
MYFIFQIIRRYITLKRQKKDLLAMDTRALNDIGISRTDAERFAGRYKIGYGKEWRFINERNNME